MTRPLSTAASRKHDPAPRGNPGAGRGAAPAPFPIGADHRFPVVDEPSTLTAEAGAPSLRSEQYGPSTTSRMEGAGGPFNRWDREIAAAHRRNNPQLARRLQEARAKWNVAFGVLEPVWIPTDSQRAMLRLRAGAAVDGFAVEAA